MKFKYLIIILATLFLLPLEKGNALLAYKSVTTYEEKLVPVNSNILSMELLPKEIITTQTIIERVSIPVTKTRMVPKRVTTMEEVTTYKDVFVTSTVMQQVVTTRQVPITTIVMVPYIVTKEVPVTTLKLVTKTIYENRPVTTWVAVTKTKQVPVTSTKQVPIYSTRLQIVGYQSTPVNTLVCIPSGATRSTSSRSGCTLSMVTTYQSIPIYQNVSYISGYRTETTTSYKTETTTEWIPKTTYQSVPVNSTSLEPVTTFQTITTTEMRAESRTVIQEVREVKMVPVEVRTLQRVAEVSLRPVTREILVEETFIVNEFRDVPRIVRTSSVILVPTPVNTPGTIFQSITTAVTKEVPYCTEPQESLPNCDPVLPVTPISGSSNDDSGLLATSPEVSSVNTTLTPPMPSNDSPASIASIPDSTTSNSLPSIPNSIPTTGSNKSNYKVS
jgi:hypothetical protein